MPTTRPIPVPGADLEERAAATGRALAGSLEAVLAAVPEGDQGPQRLARALGLDKVLASRLLKAVRQRDPLAVLHHAPGPEPLRRVLQAARERGAGADSVAQAEAAVEGFEQLIRRDAGDRSSLGAILAAWLPEAREEFEVRRKQAAFRARSELKGVASEVAFSTVLLHPSAEPGRLDLVWLIGQHNLQRLRPGVVVRFLTRRMGPDDAPRRPTNLEGEEIEGLDRARLDALCEGPPAPLEAHGAGDMVHYTLGETGFGPDSKVDVLLAEVNRAELPDHVPPGSDRRAYFFHSVEVPSRCLQFDVHVHEDVYPGADPELLIYDTCGRGMVDVNDRSRDIDRLDVAESVQPLGLGSARVRSSDVSGYSGLLRHAHERMGWDARRFRGYRCRIAYPIYGSQVCLAFRPPEGPA